MQFNRPVPVPAPDSQAHLIVQQRSFGDRLCNSIRSSGETFSAAAKMLSISSAVVGAVIMIAYLHACGAPLPLESATVPYLVLLAAIFLSISVPATLFLLMPGVLLFGLPRELQRLFPVLYKHDLSGCYTEYFRSYGSFYRPFLLTAGSWCSLIWFANRPHDVRLVILPVALGAGCVWLYFAVRRHCDRKLALIVIWHYLSGVPFSPLVG